MASPLAQLAFHLPGASRLPARTVRVWPVRRQPPSLQGSLFPLPGSWCRDPLPTVRRSDHAPSRVQLQIRFPRHRRPPPAPPVRPAPVCPVPVSRAERDALAREWDAKLAREGLAVYSGEAHWKEIVKDPAKAEFLANDRLRDEAEPEPDPDAESRAPWDLIADVARPVLDRAMERVLTPPQRQAVEWLRAGIPHHEIARLRECSKPVVTVMIQRALRKVHAELLRTIRRSSRLAKYDLPATIAEPPKRRTRPPREPASAGRPASAAWAGCLSPEAERIPVQALRAAQIMF
jgi:DNA-directed RNA polymerase specialized sigma24 family protein